MKRYPFLIVFRENRDTIELLAIAHGRRRPGHWQDRKT
jgi:hypothetical protein